MEHTGALGATREGRKYYNDKKLGDLFQGMTAALVYHQPDDPIDFLLDQIASIQDSGNTSNVSWSSFLPPGDATSRRSRPTSLGGVGRSSHTPLSSKRQELAGSPARTICSGTRGLTTSSPTHHVDTNTPPTERSDEGVVRTQTSMVESVMGEDLEESEDVDTTLLPEQSHSKTFWDVLRGSMSDLPAMPTNTVRIFLSSTFSDFKAERNILPQFAYPRLEEFCAARGVDFQVVDMRWGVTDELVQDHGVSPLCISEIKTCQQLSCGPNFVVLLGDRYGWQGFPPRIDNREFTALMSEVTSDEDIQLLNDWFRRDDNAVPPEYVLQPIQVHFQHFDDANDREKREADQNAWNKVSTRIHKILRSCAKSAAENGAIEEEQREKYFISVTEEEILQGVFHSDDPSNQVMCYHRSLQGLQDAPRSKYLAKFTELTSESKVDEEAEMFRSKLLQEKLRPHLPPSNIKDYKVDWKDVPLQLSVEPEHTKYLQKFCEDFTNNIKDIVCRKLAADSKIDDGEKLMALYHEVLHHARFGQMKCEVFCGRQDEIQRIKDYLTQGQNGGHAPLVLHGVSGMGKTALMAYISSRLHDWLGFECCSVLRFLGTSPLSTNISETLCSVIDQLSLAFGVKETGDSSKGMFGSIRRTMHALLEEVSKKATGRVVLMLDSIDQLSTANGAHRMVWLPKVLPRNVHVIVSVLTEDRMNTLANIKKRLLNESHYLELSPLSEFTGDQIIDSHLARNKRSLTEEQRELVVDAFKSMRHPLFLKLVIDEAKMWTSYLPLASISVLRPEGAINEAVKAAIIKLFEGMEVKHGATFVQHALGYLTCSNGGLTDIEMEDILSCDDHVLNEVYKYHEPPLEGVIRIPSLLWSRLQHALREYICQRRVDRKVVLTWYHRQFWEAAHMRYLQTESKKQYMHEALTELFLQETGIRRTITLHQCRGKVIQNADRRVKLQPLEVTNARKLQAVPYHLYHSSNHELLISRCLINFEWLLLKLQAFNINTVIRNYEEMDVHPNVSFFKKFLEISFDALSKDPYLLAYNIIERLGECSKVTPVLETVVADATKWLATIGVPLLLPTHPIQLMSADSPQLFCTMLGYDGLMTNDERMIVCTWHEADAGVTKIQTLDLKTRDIVSSVNIIKPAPFQIMPDNNHFLFAKDQSLGIYELDTGDVITSISMFDEEFEKITVRCLAVSENGRWVVVAIKFGKPKNHDTSKQWKSDCTIYLLDFEENKVIKKIPFRGRKLLDNLFFVQNDQIIVGTSKNKISLYTRPDLGILKEVSYSDDLHGTTFQIYSEKALIVGQSSRRKEVKVILFDYAQIEIRSSENVHVDGDQEKAFPFAMHVNGDLSALLLGSYGVTGEQPLSSICVWLPNKTGGDAYIRMQMTPRGYKPPNALTTTKDWAHALVGWHTGEVSVVDLRQQQELKIIPVHAHAIYYMKLLSDGETLVTASQDHCLKIWALPMLLQKAHDINPVENKIKPLEKESQSENEMKSQGQYSDKENKIDPQEENSQARSKTILQADHCLDDMEQCLDLIACDQFMVSAPSNNLSAPRFWSYEDGHILLELSMMHQKLYDASIEKTQLDFPTRMHGAILELPGEVLVYERKRRKDLTTLVTSGYGERAKVLAHHRFLDTYFRVILPVSIHSMTGVLYAVHNGILGVYNMLTLKPLAQVDIPPITEDITHIDSTGGKKRLAYYRVAVTIDERYLLIVNAGGGSCGKYMDIVQVQKFKYKKRIPLVKDTKFTFLLDGVYFICKDKQQELNCFPAGICQRVIEQRGSDFDYRCLVLTGKFLSKDKSIGVSVENRTHTIHVWCLEPLCRRHSLSGHEHGVKSVNISQDNQFVVSGSYDNTVRVWCLDSGTQVCMFHVFGAVNTVQFSPSMSHVAVECYSGTQRKRGIALSLRNVLNQKA